MCKIRLAIPIISCYYLKTQQLLLRTLILFSINFLEGKKHDSGILRMSGLYEDLHAHSWALDGTPLCIYGDPAYPLRVHLQTGFRGANLTLDQQMYNRSMSRVRTSVEWTFGEITNYWAFLDFKKNLKIGLSAVGKMYLVGTLLRNALTCCYGSQVCDYFNLKPPTLNEYFN